MAACLGEGYRESGDVNAELKFSAFFSSFSVLKNISYSANKVFLRSTLTKTQLFQGTIMPHSGNSSHANTRYLTDAKVHRNTKYKKIDDRNLLTYGHCKKKEIKIDAVWYKDAKKC